MSISTQTRLEEIAKTERILKELKECRKVFTLYIANLVDLLGEDTQKLWEQGFIQNSELANMVVEHKTMQPMDKIMFLDFLVKDSDHANGITAYTSILKNQKRRLREFSKRAQFKVSLRDYLGCDNLG